MGSGASSLPDVMTESEAKELLGDHFHEDAFKALADSEGHITRDQIMAYHSNPEDDDDDVEFFEEEEEHPGLGGGGGKAAAVEVVHENEDGSLEFADVETEKVSFMAVKPWVGAIKGPSNFDESLREVLATAPESELTMQWVHGYRCRDAFNNIAVNQSNGEIIWPAAATNVIYNPSDHTQRHVVAHPDDVRSLAMSNDGTLVATGGQGRKPEVVVWRTDPASAGAEVCRFDGDEMDKKRSIKALAFSPDDTMLVCVGDDNDHSLLVFSVKGGGLLASAKGGPDRIIAVGWDAKCGVVTMGVKHAKFWNGGKHPCTEKPKSGMFGKAKRCTMSSLCFAGGSTYSGGGNGMVYRWSGNAVSTTFQAHKGPIFSLVTVPGDPDGAFLSGGLDGMVHLWKPGGKAPCASCAVSPPAQHPREPCGISALAVDLSGGAPRLVAGTKRGSVVRCPLPSPGVAAADAAVEAPVVERLTTSHCAGEVWALSVHPFELKFATGGDDNTVRVFDIEARKELACRVIDTEPGPDREAGHGASSMSKYAPNQMCRAVAYLPTGEGIACGLNDGTVLILDCDVEKPPGEALGTLFRWRDSKQWIQVLKFDPSGDFLAVGSHDCKIYIYDTEGLMSRSDPPALLAQCKGHTSFVTHLDWSADGANLRSNCGGYELLFWGRAEGWKQLPGGASQLKDTQWDSTTCTLGWDVQGIWPPRAMGCQVNALARSRQAGGGDGGDYNVPGVMATADDFGMVKLFRWPSPIMTIPLGRSNPGLIEGKVEAKEFRGHSSHVSNVIFTSEFATDPGTEYCISVGGNDDCAIVWKHTF